MDFALAPELEALRRRVAEFVAAEILPVEADRASWDAHENLRLDRLAPSSIVSTDWLTITPAEGPAVRPIASRAATSRAGNPWAGDATDGRWPSRRLGAG